MKLGDLVAGLGDVEITHLSENNHDIVPGTLFFCLKGAFFDAHSVVDEVIDAGAVAIVYTDELATKRPGIVYYRVEDILAEMASISTAFFHHPSESLRLIGVTGTNGKTTIAWVFRDLLDRLASCGYIGTIDIEYAGQTYKNHFTTPKPIELNYHLARMVEDGVDYCALEISSHALTLKRTLGMTFAYAIMTNLTFEHVNFHGSMEAYAQAKRLLFENLDSDAVAILNADDDTCADFAAHTSARVVTYGIHNPADVMARDIHIRPEGTSFTLSIFGREIPIQTNLVGEFNVSNLLPVLAVLDMEGYDPATIAELLATIVTPKGRMDRINEGQDFEVIVDYAHTPDGFDKVFQYAQQMATGPIVAVFGSAGGDRDREKRPVLGQIASRYADRIILTMEDPRTEKVCDINAAIRSGMEPGPDIVEIELREEAIEHALRTAEPGAMVLVLAKADDRYNVVGNEDMAYDGDLDVTRQVLRQMKAEREEKAA